MPTLGIPTLALPKLALPKLALPALRRLSLAATLAALAASAGAQYVYVTNFQYAGHNPEILRFSSTTGALVDHFVTGAATSLGAGAHILIGPDGRLYALDEDGILRLDLRTGASLGRFVASHTLIDMTFGPDGNLYALDSAGGPQVRRYDGATGAGLGVFVAPGPSLAGPTNLLFGPDGALYVSDPFTNRDVRRFDGATGAFLGVFIAPVAGVYPNFLHFAPNGSLYVSSSTGPVRRYDAATGSFLANLTVPTEFGPAGLATGPDGDLYVVDELGRGVARFSESNDAYGGLLVASGAAGLAYPRGIVFGPCSTGQGSLCVNQARFRVVAHWRTKGGATGLGTPVQLTADTGYLWFFGRANVEVVAKVLDGCAVNGRYWVFASGLTDVFVRLDVTDTATGVTKSYTNPLGTPFKAIQDTAAFASCP